MLRCGNPACCKEISGGYTMVRKPRSNEDVPVCGDECQKAFYESVAPKCVQCSKILLGSLFTINDDDGKELCFCTEACVDKYQDALRPVCIQCGKNVPPEYLTITIPGRDEPEPVCNEACFTEVERKELGPPKAAKPRPPPEQVCVFGRDSCGETHRVMETLKVEQIKFVQKDIDEDDTYSEVLFDSGFEGGDFDLPVVTFGDKAYWQMSAEDLAQALKAAGA